MKKKKTLNVKIEQVASERSANIYYVKKKIATYTWDKSVDNPPI